MYSFINGVVIGMTLALVAVYAHIIGTWIVNKVWPL